MPTRKERAKRLNIPIDQLPDGRGKHGNHRRGKGHPRWNHGHAISSHGYNKIFVGRNHPFADPKGYAYEHILVWVSAGNTIDSKCVIHHLNGNTQDNRLENLHQMLRGDHMDHHVNIPNAIKKQEGNKTLTERKEQ